MSFYSLLSISHSSKNATSKQVNLIKMFYDKQSNKSLHPFWGQGTPSIPLYLVVLQVKEKSDGSVLVKGKKNFLKAIFCLKCKLLYAIRI